MDLTGIYNDNEFYTEHYLSELFGDDIKDVLKAWRDEAETESQTPYKRLEALNRPFFELHNNLSKYKNGQRIEELRSFYKEQLKVLGYEFNHQLKQGADDVYLPVANEIEQHGRPTCWVLECGFVSVENEEDTDLDPLELEVAEEQLSEAPVDADTVAGMSIFDVVNKVLFRMEEPPRWVVIVGPGQTVLIDRSKWNEKRILRFDWSEIFGRREKETLQASAVLLHRENLAPSDGEALHETLDEASHKHAYGVSKDLKYSVREAVEKLGNEAIWYLRNVSKVKVYEGEINEREFTNECLRYLYRMLFLFYIEARPELGFAPMDSEVYRKGYSLEHLRDLEMVNLTTPEGRNGYYIDKSISKLFKYVFEGITPEGSQGSLLEGAGDEESQHNTFSISSLHGHIFDPHLTPTLNKVKLRNHVWQDIIELMSLTREGGARKRRGRVSYAQLGINQLGAVYEGLLSYTGFFAEEDLYEVKKAKETYDPLKHAYFVTKDELDEYKHEERVFKNGEQLMHPKGSFIYRLSGREREKSASYYTPEVLTESLVKYSLKELVTDEMSADDLLKLTLCEPAMGSGAFINEGMNQLADLYLQRKQEELGEALDPDQYTYEKQRVKAYLADNNVYGVDLNPIAVELAEVSLWLNTIHKDGHVPWFGEQLRTGNSLIGARREVYRTDQLTQSKGRYGAWMFEAPKRVPLDEDRDKHEIYHFLLPDNNMSKYNDKTVKKRYKEEIKEIKDWQNQFVKSFDEEDLQTFRNLSNAVDQLWETHVEQLKRLKDRVEDPLPIYGHDDIGDVRRKSTRQKDDLWNKVLRSHNVQASSPYRRLKLAMDYWCALWFWPIDKADLLPSRDQYLMDLQMILEGEVYGMSFKAGEQKEMFASDFMVEEQKELFEEIGYVDVDELCDKFDRLRVVQDLAERYRFMHWELEFADLFADEGGFDLILGNPPWLQINWNESGVLGDFKPLFNFRNFSASKISKKREVAFSENSRLESLWKQEYEEAESTQNFLNASSNFKLLEGQKANLYKCFVPKLWYLESPQGIVGLLHPEGLYEDPKGRKLRSRLYIRLRNHFQLVNELQLFKDVDHHTKFSINIYGPKREKIKFNNISNLFTPTTIDRCFNHDGSGSVPGVKEEQIQKGGRITTKWGVAGHSNRIIQITSKELKLFQKVFEEEETLPGGARLLAIHSQELILVLKKFANQKLNFSQIQEDYFTTQHWNETNAQKEGIISRNTQFPDSIDSLILSGPHFFVCNPFYKTPRRVCEKNSNYDEIDLTKIDENYIPRTNYIPDCSTEKYRNLTPKVSWKTQEDENEKPVTDFFRIAWRKMISSGLERTLVPSLIPKKVGHIFSLVSVAFKNQSDLIVTAGLMGSILYDFFVKTTGKSNFTNGDFKILPFIEPPVCIKSRIFSRVLTLSCLTKDFKQLWDNNCDSNFQNDSWTKKCTQLKMDFFKCVTKSWEMSSALRTDYMRRQAMIEIDVLVAITFGLTLDELNTLYRVQFPVLREYEADTWYDQNGRIVFTASRGLTGVGLKRTSSSAKRVMEDKAVVGYSVDAPNMQVENEAIGWNDVKHLEEGVVYKTFMDDTQPGGPVERTVEFHAPFDRCDREEDYETAWKAFEERGITSDTEAGAEV